MELQSEVVGKVIRVYWAKEKEWYTGQISEYNSETGNHTIQYNDGDSEELDLISLEKDRPAWELSPFTSEYFQF